MTEKEMERYVEHIRLNYPKIHLQAINFVEYEKRLFNDG